MSLTTDCGKVSSPAALLPLCHSLLVDRSHRNVPQRGSSGIRSHGGNNNLGVLKKGHLRENSLTVQPAQNLIFSIKRRAKEQKGNSEKFCSQGKAHKYRNALLHFFHKQTRHTSGSYTLNFYDPLFVIFILLLSHLVLHLQMALRSQFVILFKHN